MLLARFLGLINELTRTVLFLADVIQPDLHQLNIRPRIPPDALPKFLAGRIAGEEEDGAFLDAKLAEFCQARLDELPAKAALPVPFGNGEMMQVAAPAIVAAQRGADDATIFLRHKTHARVASQIRGDGRARVGLVQPHAFAAPPQGDDGVVIFDAKNAEDDCVRFFGPGKIVFHSTVTLFARLRGLSTSQPRATAM